MTAYVVLREHNKDDTSGYEYIERIQATNAEQACRRAAEKFSDADLKDDVTLVAVPVRNWTSGRNTFAAKTERKLIRS